MHVLYPCEVVVQARFIATQLYHYVMIKRRDKSRLYDRKCFLLSRSIKKWRDLSLRFDLLSRSI